MTLETTYVKFSYEDGGDVAFKPTAVFREDTEHPLVLLEALSEYTLVMGFPDGDYTKVLVITDVVIEETQSSLGDDKLWTLAYPDLYSKYTNEQSSTLSLGIPTGVWKTLVEASKTATKVAAVHSYSAYTTCGVTFVPAEASKEVPFTITLDSGKPERMPDLLSFMERARSSVLANVGIQVDAVKSASGSITLELNVVSVHVKDFTTVRSPRVAVGASCVAMLDEAGAESFVQKLKSRGLLPTTKTADGDEAILIPLTQDGAESEASVRGGGGDTESAEKDAADEKSDVTEKS